jgi:hypothetical protein
MKGGGLGKEIYMNFNFGEILTRAWQIIWKHKVLWIFGILAGCTQGGSGGGGSGSGGGDGSDGPPSQLEMQRASEVYQWFSDHPWVIVAIVVAILLLWALAIFLGTIGRIGLIRGTLQVEAGAASLSFGPLFTESRAYFWRVFGLVFLVGLIALLPIVALILLAIMFGLGMSQATETTEILATSVVCLLLPLTCILIPIGLVMSLVVEVSNVAIVSEDLSMLDGLRRGWKVARSNVGPVIVMAVILFVLSFMASIVVAIPLFLTVVPAVLAMGITQGESMAPLWVAGLCFVAYLPVLITLRGIMTAYTQSAWTLTYLRLTGPKESSPAPIQANA